MPLFNQFILPALPFLQYYKFNKMTMRSLLGSRELKNEQQNNAPSPKQQCSCRLLESSENRAFEGCRSTYPLPSTDFTPGNVSSVGFKGIPCYLYSHFPPP